MGTFGTIIIIIVLVIIGKFIYDTYLTNNTDKNFEEYRKKDPIAAAKLELPQTEEEFDDLVQSIDNELHVIPKHSEKTRQLNSVKFDGVYLFRHEGVSPNGKPYKLSILFIFNDKNRAMKVEYEGFEGPILTGLRPALNEFAAETDINNNVAEYSCNNELITMEFKNSNTHSEVYSGSIINNGLMLTRYLHLWDELKNAPNKKVSLQNMRFEFLPVTD